MQKEKRRSYQIVAYAKAADIEKCLNIDTETTSDIDRPPSASNARKSSAKSPLLRRKLSKEGQRLFAEAVTSDDEEEFHDANDGDSLPGTPRKGFRKSQQRSFEEALAQKSPVRTPSSKRTRAASSPDVSFRRRQSVSFDSYAKNPKNGLMRTRSGSDTLALADSVGDSPIAELIQLCEAGKITFKEVEQIVAADQKYQEAQKSPRENEKPSGSPSKAFPSKAMRGLREGGASRKESGGKSMSPDGLDGSGNGRQPGKPGDGTTKGAGDVLSPMSPSSIEMGWMVDLDTGERFRLEEYEARQQMKGQPLASMASSLLPTDVATPSSSDHVAKGAHMNPDNPSNTSKKKVWRRW